MDFGVVYAYRHLIINGFIVTVELSILAIVTSTLVGLFAGILKTSKYKVISWPISLYIEIFRGSPVLMQLFMVYFGLPYMGISISIFNATLLVFTLYSGAYIAEIVRGGIQAISKGQYEAAQSIGLSYGQMMRHVILPQALKVILPPLVGWYIGLIKDTSIASIIGYSEVLKQGQDIINITDRPFEIYFTIAALYFLISYPLSLVVSWMERRTQFQ